VKRILYRAIIAPMYRWLMPKSPNLSLNADFRYA